MVNLYVADISKLPDPLQCTALMEKLPLARQQKIRKLQQLDSRKQSFGAGLLLEKVLARNGKLSANLRITESGKPEIDGLCFNLSHSGNIVICAVSKDAVGCDIERIKEAPKRVAERKFSNEENAYLQQFSGDLYNREFFRIWTKKESHLKMTGTGISVPLSSLKYEDCFVKEYEIPGYQITVCAKENEFANLTWENI